ncbi:MAG: hypothetical protein ABIM89_02000 [Mycobacteriales bacterium]
MGSLSGEEFVVETPVLVALLGPTWESSPIEAMIESAVAAGARVVVPEHHIEELLELVDTVEARYIDGLRRALEGGMRASTYAASVKPGILQSWVAGLDEGKYQHWADYRKAAIALRDRLIVMGAIVRPHNNANAVTVTRFRDALANRITQTGKYRADLAIDRDAETMAMVLRHRRAVTGSHLWPGSWIVTPDRHIAHAYRAVSTDPIQVTITASQCATLVAHCSSAPTIEQLATASAPLVVRDAALAIASRYPPDAALEFARTLSSAMESTTIDVRVGRVDLDAVIDRNAESEAEEGIKHASEVLARRARRMQAADATRSGRDQAEMARAAAAEGRAEAVAAAERHAREIADARAAVNDSRVGDLETQIRSRDEQILSERTAAQTLSSRRVRLAVFLTVVFAVAVGAAFIGWRVFAGATVIVVLIFWHQTHGWRNDVETRIRSLWPAVIVEALGLADLVWSLSR